MSGAYVALDILLKEGVHENFKISVSAQISLLTKPIAFSSLKLVPGASDSISGKEFAHPVVCNSPSISL